MSDIILCYEKDCDGDQKFTEDFNQFMRKGGPHEFHKKAYFSELCANFLGDRDNKMKQEDSNSLLIEVTNLFEIIKRDFQVKIDECSHDLIQWVQSIFNNDKVVQLYLSIVTQDLQKFEEFSGIFHLLGQPENIEDAYCKIMDDAHQKIMNTQNNMKEILKSINFYQQGPLKEYEEQKTMNVEGKHTTQQDDQQLLQNELTNLQKKFQVVQNIKNINIVSALEAQQDIINSLYKGIILQEKYNYTQNDYSMGNIKIEQSIFQERLTQLQQQNQIQYKNLRQIFKNANQNTPKALTQQTNVVDQQFSKKVNLNSPQIHSQGSINKEIMINSHQTYFQSQQNESTRNQNYFSFSQEFKRSSITVYSSGSKTGAAIYPPVAAIKSPKNPQIQQPDRFGMALMIPALDSGQSVTFGFEIKEINSGDQWMAVGMCHLDQIIKNRFLFNGLQQIGHGCYMVSTYGYSYSTTDSHFNHKGKSFPFVTNDIIYCYVDPNNQTIKFERAQSNEIFVMRYIPTGSQLHPCVCLYNTNNRVEFIQPEHLKNKGYQLS